MALDDVDEPTAPLDEDVTGALDDGFEVNDVLSSPIFAEKEMFQSVPVGGPTVVQRIPATDLDVLVSRFRFALAIGPRWHGSNVGIRV